MAGEDVPSYVKLAEEKVRWDAEQKKKKQELLAAKKVIIKGIGIPFWDLVTLLILSWEKDARIIYRTRFSKDFSYQGKMRDPENMLNPVCRHDRSLLTRSSVIFSFENSILKTLCLNIFSMPCV